MSQLGKYKTAMTMVALVVLLANPPLLTNWVILGNALLMLSAVLTLWSMYVYLKAAWPYMSMETEKKADE